MNLKTSTQSPLENSEERHQQRLEAMQNLRQAASMGKREEGQRRIKGLHEMFPSEYGTWSKLKGRCLNPNDAAYNYYGGRGLTVCDRWLESFHNFLEDMGPKPSPELTLERINNNSGYSRENCTWATRAVQSANRRSVNRLTLNGRTQSMADWSRETGLSIGLIHIRLKHGWSVENALTKESALSVSRKKSSEALDAIREGISTRRGIVGLFGGKTIADKILSRLISDGKIIRESYGKYKLK
jgi:hypothetical protein